jgi:TonB-linked SusC/RagA family outer membrane protein
MDYWKPNKKRMCMKLIRKITIFLIALSAIQTISAQGYLTGTVRDAQNNEPLTGANVYVLNSENRSVGGCIVDFNGEYHMKIPETANLNVVFSFVGFKSKTVKYTGQKTIDVKLEEDGRSLDVVEVTAKRVERNSLGQTPRERVSAISKVTLEGLETANVTNVTEALQGALANVDILTGADPGSGSSIRIRGTSSLSANSNPLFVLDGVPMPVDVSSDFSFATANSDDYSQLLNISPSDILSIEVLKDAAATAVWGSKGANGVLLITTKRGSKGRMSMQYSSKYELRKEGSSIPMLNAKQYVSMIQDAIWNSVNDIGQGASEANTYMALLYNTKEIGYDPDWTYFDEYNQNVNWLEKITQRGMSFDNSFSLSGGGEKADYRLSLGNLTEEGTTIGTKFERFSGKFNMTYKFSDRLDISTNYSFTRGIRNATYSDGYLNESIRGQALVRMPNMSPYIIGDNGLPTKEYFTPYSFFQGSFATNSGVYNPVALANEAKNRTVSVSSSMIFNLHYKIAQGFDYTGVVGFQSNLNKTDKFLPQSVTGESYISKYTGMSSDGGSDVLYLTTENRLVFIKSIADKHRITLSGVWQTSDQNSSSYVSYTTGNASVGITDPVVGSNMKNYSGGSGHVTNRDMGGFINGQYTFNDRYIFNAGYRVEASSSMPANTRWGAFPTVGAAWIFGDEDFMKQYKFLSLGKIRLNWGQSGNSPSGSAPYIGSLSAIANGYGEMVAIQPVKIQLGNITYEILTQTNVGIDFGFLDNRLNISVDLYDKVTSNMLQGSVSVPSTTGYTSVAYYNSGKMENKGWDISTDAVVLKDKKWKVSFNFNIAQNRNEILELPGNKQDLKYSFGNKEYAYKFTAGEPLGSFYGYKYLGVYQNIDETYASDGTGSTIYDINGVPVIMKNGSIKVYPGDAKYADVNHDGLINKYDIVYIGNSNPLFIGGFGVNVSYKNIGLVATFHGRAGQKVINSVRMNNEYMYGKDNQSTAVLRRWRHEGDNTEIPRALYNRGYNDLGSDRFLEDASFLRLKTLTLKYDLPKELAAKLHIRRLQVYATGYDLLTFTGYKGQDPEISMSRIERLYPMYIDNASTPKPQRFAFGLNVNL